MNHTASTPQPHDALVTACTTRRMQPYRLVHKSLRTMLSQALHHAGALDAAEAQERIRLVDEVEQLLAICADHLAHENRFLHEPLRARAPREVLAFDHDHLDHLDAIGALRVLLQRLRDASDDGDALAYELYLRLSQFVADNLAHMAEEESTLTCALWSHFSDAELQIQIDRLHATLSPAELEGFMRGLAGSLNGSELSMLLAEMRQALPPEAATAMAGVLRDELHIQRRHGVAVRLVLQPAPAVIAA